MRVGHEETRRRLHFPGHDTLLLVDEELTYSTTFQIMQSLRLDSGNGVDR